MGQTEKSIEKKREMLCYIHDAIKFLVGMSADAAKLEIHDNEKASRRHAQDWLYLKNKFIPNAFKVAKEVRTECIGYRNSVKARKRKTVVKKVEGFDSGFKEDHDNEDY